MADRNLIFKGPRRPRYTPQQFADCYGISLADVHALQDIGFLRATYQAGRRVNRLISEHDRLVFERQSLKGFPPFQQET